MRVRTLLLPALLAATSFLPLSSAFVAGPDRPHHADLADLAAARLPAEWRAILASHRASFREGAIDPDGQLNASREVHTFYHAYEPKDGGGGAVYRVALSLHEATMALREGRSEAEVAYQMGFLTHFSADLAMPLHTAENLYDHEKHEVFEHAMYDHAAEYGVTAPSRPPQEVADVEAYAVALAERSAALGTRIDHALAATEGAWSPELRDIAAESTALAVEATADLLYTAFARADPTRPDPVFAAADPMPRELEDVGLSVPELRKHQPWVLVLVPVLALVALGGITALVARRHYFKRRFRRAARLSPRAIRARRRGS